MQTLQRNIDRKKVLSWGSRETKLCWCINIFTHMLTLPLTSIISFSSFNSLSNWSHCFWLQQSPVIWPQQLQTKVKWETLHSVQPGEYCTRLERQSGHNRERERRRSRSPGAEENSKKKMVWFKRQTKRRRLRTRQHCLPITALIYSLSTNCQLFPLHSIWSSLSCRHLTEDTDDLHMVYIPSSSFRICASVCLNTEFTQRYLVCFKHQIGTNESETPNVTSLFPRPPTNQSKRETWTWLFPNLSWTTDGIIYHHCPKIRSKEEKERRRWLQDTARTMAAVVETYGTRIFGPVFAGNQWHLIGCTSRLCCQREGFCFQGWKIWHQSSINAGIISDAVHLHSTWLDGTFSRDISLFFKKIIPRLEKLCLSTHFSDRLHIFRSTLCIIVSRRRTHCHDCGTRMTSQPANLCPTWLSVNTSQSKGFEPVHGDSYKRTEESVETQLMTMLSLYNYSRSSAPKRINLRDDSCFAYGLKLAW